MARAAEIFTGQIVLEARFYVNGVLFDPYTIENVDIYDVATGGVPLATGLTPVKTAVGVYEVTWYLPIATTAGTYYDEWQWEAVQGQGQKINRTRFYLQDGITSLTTAKASPYAPNELPGMAGCLGAVGWACCESIGPEPPVYAANCPSGTQVGDCVYVTGPKVSGRYQVATADPADPLKMPAAGIVLDKASATECTIQVIGRIVGIVGTQDPADGQVLYVGTDGKPTQDPPDPPNEVQALGTLLAVNEIQLNPDWSAGGGGGTGGGTGGWIRIIDASVSGGQVTDKVWQDTGQTVLQSCTVSGLTVTLSLKASYPKVESGAASAELTEAASGGFYEGTLDVTITGDGVVSVEVVSPDDENGPYDTIDLTVALPPTILSLSFTGGYPGAQTELEAGNTFQLTGTTDIPADAVQILDFGAMVQSVEVFAAGTSFTVTGTIADRGDTPQALPARVQARDATTGAYGPTRDTNELGGTTDGVDLVTLNNEQPTAVWGSPSYPVTQQALKASEQATVPVTITNADTVTFSSPTAELSITNPTTIETPKTVTRIGGTYNVSTDNLRVVATRSANGAQVTADTVVQIAAVAAVVNVVVPAARLRSGGNDGTAAVDHNIQLQAGQQLIEAPTLDEDTGGGTFQGSWAGGPSTWTRDLRVHDDDTKASYTFQNLSAKNLANIITTTINSGAGYVLGGFISRTLTLAAFQDETTMNVVAVTYGKVSINWEVKALPNQRAVGTTVPPPDPNSWCLNELGPVPVTVRILDTAATLASSVATDVVMEESV